MDAASVIPRSVVAVHLTESATWARTGDRIVERPAGVTLSAGRVVVGVDTASASAETFEAAPMRFVGDDVLLLGTTAVDVAEVLEEVLADALVAVGAATPVDHLVVTCPTGWGAVRRQALVTAGRRLAREVRVTPVADLASTVMEADGAPRFGVVLEIGMLASTATATVGAGAVTVDTIGSMDLTSRPDAAGELVDAVHGAIPDLPDWVAVVGDLPQRVVDAVELQLRRRWAAAVPVHVTPAPRLLGSALDRVSPHSGTAPDRSAVKERESPQVGASRRRTRLAGALGVVAVLAGLGVWAGFTVVGGSTSGVPVAQEPPAPPSVSEEAVAPVPTPVPPKPSAAAPVRVSTGRASLDVPAGWHRQAPSDGSDRIELVRADGRRARILLVQKDLTEGADLDGVAATLGDQIAARSDVFGPIDRVVFDGRPALSYMETPDTETQVVWRVFVVDGLQISVGCQAPLTDSDSLDPACGEVARSITVAVS